MTEEQMPADPFVSPETLGMMRALHEFHSAAMASGFPERIATEIIIGVIASVIRSAAQAQA